VLSAARRHARELVAFAEAGFAWFFCYGCRAEALPHILKRLDLATPCESHGDTQAILATLERLRNT
jgi:hypothetical protein